MLEMNLSEDWVFMSEEFKKNEELEKRQQDYNSLHRLFGSECLTLRCLPVRGGHRSQGRFISSIQGALWHWLLVNNFNSNE